MSKINHNQMKSLINKEKSMAFVLMIILTISSAVAFMPKVNAQSVYTTANQKGSNGLWNVPTWPGLTVAPSPVGVGQPVQVIMIIELLPASQGVEAKTGVYGGWQGFTLTITNPNGTTTTLGPYESDVSGTYQVSYTPDTVGTYTFQFSFPGQTDANVTWGGINGDPLYYNANFMPSTSEKVALTVQQAPVTGYFEAAVPLPTAYWTSPIDAQNRGWNVISGPWLMSGYNATGAFNPYTYAPQSSHILWTQSEYPANGGLIGGIYGSLEFARNTGFSNPIIMGGYMYYNGPADNTGAGYFYCANLQTGQVMWKAPGSITNGQILNWRSQQSKTEIPYLWSISAGSYKLYSANTGQLLDSWTTGLSTVSTGPGGVPTVGSTTQAVVLEPPNPTVIGQDIGGAGGGGALLVYISGYNQYQSVQWLACWNSTLAINAYSGTTGWAGLPIPSTNPVVWSLPPSTATLNWSLGIMWNVTFPYIESGISTGGTTTYRLNRQIPLTVIGADQNYVVLKNNPIYDNSTGNTVVTMTAYSATTGTRVWIENITVPPYDAVSPSSSTFALDNNGLIIFPDKTLNTIYAYSESTGALLWSIDPYNNDFSLQSSTAGTVANGMLYDPGYDGYMHAINTTTGVQMWDAISTAGGLEMPQPAYPMTSATVAGGEVFTSTSKAYETEPLYRGHCLYAFDATTGAQNWNISGQYSIGAVADGILVASNAYDAKVYAFGRGQTATTVSVGPAVIEGGQNAVISGSITDQTPGVAAGTPAISDQWMTPWMQYLFMDQPYPTNAVGVSVSIDAVDPNGNYIHIGNATSDITGAYGLQWAAPNIPGKYTIITTFSSDNSYYGSCGEATAVVGLAPAAPASPTPTPTSVADMYFVPAIAGLFILIVIVAIVLALLMLRKRP